MAITKVQEVTHGQAAGATNTLTIAAPDAGSLLVVVIGTLDQRVTGITGGGVTWAEAVHDFNAKDAEIWYGFDSSGSGTSIVVTMAGSTDSAASFTEWSGIDTASPLDQTNHATATSTTPATGSVTPTSDNQLLIAMFNSVQNPSAGPTGGFTPLTQIIQGTQHVSSAYLIQTSATLASPSWTTTSAPWDACIATFKPATASSGPAVPRTTLTTLATLETLTR